MLSQWLILAIPVVVILLLLGGGARAILRGSFGGVSIGIVMVVLGAGLVIALPFMPVIAFFAIMWLAGSPMYGSGHSSSYVPPPGTPVEIALSYRMEVTLEGADGSRGSDIAVQTVTLTMSRSSNGLYPSSWKASGDNLNIHAGGRDYVTNFNRYEYGRFIVDACVPKKSYKDFAELVAAIKALKGSCDEAVPRFFIGRGRPEKKAKALPIDTAYVDKDVRATAFSLTPLRVKATMPKTEPTEVLPVSDKRPAYAKVSE